ncbi:hypothetical protein BU25DRAFT_153384 [Macroventuria anomochaeta]|uniref:Uncharacterized protein n=1 Tax=Macroventuria anomochaeta TaxID=301207 RepID=A0ACB6RRE5_9PLEO|nr:uncharacterized protein BU25DRAFT_153384 [Macroventuria anomochaeta]KAF2624476.1 hypothetical protein BU25DRAFT_153384 [Macroventuria anomochaeta]
MHPASNQTIQLLHETLASLFMPCVSCIIPILYAMLCNYLDRRMRSRSKSHSLPPNKPSEAASPPSVNVSDTSTPLLGATIGASTALYLQPQRTQHHHAPLHSRRRSEH